MAAREAIRLPANAKAIGQPSQRDEQDLTIGAQVKKTMVSVEGGGFSIFGVHHHGKGGDIGP